MTGKSEIFLKRRNSEWQSSLTAVIRSKISLFPIIYRPWKSSFFHFFPSFIARENPHFSAFSRHLSPVKILIFSLLPVIYHPVKIDKMSALHLYIFIWSLIFFKTFLFAFSRHLLPVKILIFQPFPIIYRPRKWIKCLRCIITFLYHHL